MRVSVWLEMAGTETRSQAVDLSDYEPTTIAFGDLLPGVVQVVLEPDSVGEPLCHCCGRGPKDATTETG